MWIGGSEADAEEVNGLGMVDGAKVVVDVAFVGVDLVVEVLGWSGSRLEMSFGAEEGLVSFDVEVVVA